MSTLLVGPIYQDGYAKRAIFENAGAPVNGTSGTFANVVGVGSFLVDTTNANLYINTNTAASPTWTLIGGAAAATGTNLSQLGTGTATFGTTGNVNKQLSVAGVGNGADTSEDTLFTYTLPANSLAVVGSEVNILAWGSVAATSATKTVKVYFGAISQSVPYTTTQTGAWAVNMTVIKQASNVQMAITEVDALGATTVRTITVTTNGAETDTAGIVIKVTGTSSVGTANLILANGLVVSGAN